ncbi:MAG TPA: hypothetical protein VFM18_22585 [Methanosarcina sp.]|nr:hypothetical protein [Methanosarcina sp.]
MLNFYTGHALTGDLKQVTDSDEIRIIDSEGRCVFEIKICKDQAGIEVRGSDLHKIDGVLHSNHLSIKPNFANCVTIRTEKYED